MEHFGVEIFFTHPINEGNYHQNIVIPIEPPEANIEICAESIIAIREEYRLWWRKRHAREAARNQ